MAGRTARVPPGYCRPRLAANALRPSGGGVGITVRLGSRHLRMGQSASQEQGMNGCIHVPVQGRCPPPKIAKRFQASPTPPGQDKTKHDTYALAAPAGPKSETFELWEDTGAIKRPRPTSQRFQYLSEFQKEKAPIFYGTGHLDCTAGKMRSRLGRWGFVWGEESPAGSRQPRQPGRARVGPELENTRFPAHLRSPVRPGVSVFAEWRVRESERARERVTRHGVHAGFHTLPSTNPYPIIALAWHWVPPWSVYQM